MAKFEDFEQQKRQVQQFPTTPRHASSPSGKLLPKNTSSQNFNHDIMDTPRVVAMRRKPPQPHMRSARQHSQNRRVACQYALLNTPPFRPPALFPTRFALLQTSWRLYFNCPPSISYLLSLASQLPPVPPRSYHHTQHMA